jgi:hypothetical protein
MLAVRHPLIEVKPDTVSAPPPLFSCDNDWICSADVKGAVSGAGIATLQSLPGVPVGDANLIAPHGTVDAGDAGIRASGNINIAALFVLNTFNLQAQGTITGFPTTPPPPVAALTSGNNAAGAAAKTAEAPPQSNKNDQPSIIIVEFIGFGGDGGDAPSPNDGERQPGKTRTAQLRHEKRTTVRRSRTSHGNAEARTH